MLKPYVERPEPTASTLHNDALAEASVAIIDIEQEEDETSFLNEMPDVPSVPGSIQTETPEDVNCSTDLKSEQQR